MSAGENFSKHLTNYVISKKYLYFSPQNIDFLNLNVSKQNNGHGPCQDVCINKQGGYECSCEGLPGNNKYKLSFI